MKLPLLICPLCCSFMTYISLIARNRVILTLSSTLTVPSLAVVFSILAHRRLVGCLFHIQKTSDTAAESANNLINLVSVYYKTSKDRRRKGWWMSTSTHRKTTRRAINDFVSDVQPPLIITAHAAIQINVAIRLNQ